jgi:hypothetical protein
VDTPKIEEAKKVELGSPLKDTKWWELYIKGSLTSFGADAPKPQEPSYALTSLPKDIATGP